MARIFQIGILKLVASELRSTQRTDALAYPLPAIVFCHFPLLVPQQQLRVRWIARIARRLGPNVPELKVPHARA